MNIENTNNKQNYILFLYKNIKFLFYRECKQLNSIIILSPCVLLHYSIHNVNNLTDKINKLSNLYLFIINKHTHCIRIQYCFTKICSL